jgi:hypothetical protein
MEKVVVAVCTANRPVMLSRLLCRLQDLSVATLPGTTLLVVDNRPGQGVRESSQKNLDRLEVPFLWVEEPVPGISQARNRAVLEAIAIGADAIAFLDDDNLPELGWLEALIAVARREHADVVIGNRRKADRSDQDEGLMLMVGDHLWKSDGMPELMSTANVLVGVGILKQLMISGPAFDTRFSPMGGEDADFFIRARALGAVFATAPDSIVDFRTEGARASVAGQIARKFKSGCAQAHLVRKHQRLFAAASWIGVLILRTAEQLLLLPVRSVLPQVRADACAKLGNSAGAWFGLLGGRINYYRGTGLSE